MKKLSDIYRRHHEESHSKLLLLRTYGAERETSKKEIQKDFKTGYKTFHFLLSCSDFEVIEQDEEDPLQTVKRNAGEADINIEVEMKPKVKEAKATLVDGALFFSSKEVKNTLMLSHLP